MNTEQHLAIQPDSLDSIQIGDRVLPIHYVRNRRARRYIIRLAPGGRLRATIPPFGSKREAYAFAERERSWIERQLNKSTRVQVAQPWIVGTLFYFRGELVAVEIDKIDGVICFGDERIRDSRAEADRNVGASVPADLRPLVERHLIRLAARELVPRTIELAELHSLRIHRVAIRAQRSRWGSCSRKGTISLNWRLIQMPASVSDYVILHELMHLREMNHSRAFWRCVEGVCPGYRIAERWIKENAKLLAGS